jgi:hypothetical protein
MYTSQSRCGRLGRAARPAHRRAGWAWAGTVPGSDRDRLIARSWSPTGSPTASQPCSPAGRRRRPGRRRGNPARRGHRPAETAYGGRLSAARRSSLSSTATLADTSLPEPGTRGRPCPEQATITATAGPHRRGDGATIISELPAAPVSQRREVHPGCITPSP